MHTWELFGKCIERTIYQEESRIAELRQTLEVMYMAWGDRNVKEI